MLEALWEGLLLVLQWKAFGFMLLGIGLGFWVGLLPGLGGATTLALMLPFIYTMQPVEAFAFLLGMHAVVATTGDITSVLFGVPGEATSAATVVDGYAMTKKGEAGRALGAALASSLVGAIVGAVALAAAIPVVRPLVLTFGSPELFMLAIVGLAFIASLSAQGTRGMLRGFLAGGLGLLLATVGQDPQAGVARFTFDTLYLWQGLDLVPVLVGIFAIPEIIDLFVRGNSIAGNAPPGKVAKGAWEEGYLPPLLADDPLQPDRHLHRRDAGAWRLGRTVDGVRARGAERAHARGARAVRQGGRARRARAGRGE